MQQGSNHHGDDSSGPKATVLAVTSGKGGVGKTNITANLALCLGQANKKVLIADTDMSLANLDLLLNVNCKYNISHVLSGKKSIEQIIQTGPAGIEIIGGASGIENLADLSPFHRERLLDEFSKLQGYADIMLIDTAAGISRSVMPFCLASDQVLVVTTPEATAMTDAYAMIKMLASKKYEGRINLIVNMAFSLAEGKKVYQKISSVAMRFLNIHVYDAGTLLRDDKLVAAVRARQPVVLAHPKARISVSIRKLAARLDKSCAENRQKAGFFRKVVNWFF